jgi:hypothetical protein
MPVIGELEKYPTPAEGSVWKHKLYGYDKFVFIKVGQNKNHYWWEFKEDNGWIRCFDPADMIHVKPKIRGVRGRPKKKTEEEIAVVAKKPKLEFGGKVIK